MNWPEVQLTICVKPSPKENDHKPNAEDNLGTVCRLTRGVLSTDLSVSVGDVVFIPIFI